MAFQSKRIDYTIYPPNHKPDTACWDYRTAAKVRLAARKLGAGARLRRNINVMTKDNRIAHDCWVDRVWEWKRLRGYHQEPREGYAMMLLESVSRSREVGSPDISNNVGSVKRF